MHRRWRFCTEASSSIIGWSSLRATHQTSGEAWSLIRNQQRFCGTKGRFVTPQPQLQLFRTLWGVEGMPQSSSEWAQFLHTQTVPHGFTGIECCSPGPFFSFGADPGAIKQVLYDAGRLGGLDRPLQLILQLQTTDYPVTSASWRVHADSLREKLESIIDLQLLLTSPLEQQQQPVLQLVNCHAGKDSMRPDDAIRFFEAALTMEEELLGPYKVRIAFELHRQRILHSPFVLMDLLDRAPEVLSRIALNVDVSHFIVGLERFPDEVNDAEFWPRVRRVLETQAQYVHARMATSEQIQVHAVPLTSNRNGDNDRSSMLRFYTDIWRSIACDMCRRGVPVRICPEYGPPPYQPLFEDVGHGGSSRGDDAKVALERVVLDATAHLKASIVEL